MTHNSPIMTRSGDKVEKLLNAAKALIHEQGFKQTTLADIAKRSGVPLGNVYYYFKTKDDIAAAVIDEYLRGLKQSLDEIEAREAEPKNRVLAYLKRSDSYSDTIADYGCPVGSLCQELNKDCDCTPLAEQADSIFKTQIRWIETQFKQMKRDDAADAAVQFIATLQGISLLANATRDAALASRQIIRLREWVESL